MDPDITDDPRGAGPVAADRRPNWPLAAAAACGLAGFAALYLVAGGVYARLIDLWSFEPFARPFLDTEYVLAQIRCWREGVDVYAVNPCDWLGRVHDYSPLWLRLPLPWIGEGAAAGYGLLLDAAFVASLAVLPRPRAAPDGVAVLLALFSPFCMFALERGNPDVLMFVLAAAGLLCLERRPWVRAVGYGAMLLAGLLKFYPLVLLLLLLRERPGRFVLLAVGAGAIVVGCFALYHAETLRALANITVPSMTTDGFGASQAPLGLIAVLRVLRGTLNLPNNTSWSDIVIWAAVYCLLRGLVVCVALWLGRSAALASAVRRMTGRERTCFAAGAILVCGCFFSGASIGYRAVLVLFALPGLLALGRLARDRAVASACRGAAFAAIAAMWCLPAQRLIADGFGRWWLPEPVAGVRFIPEVGMVFWMLREVCWWWLVAVLSGVLVRWVAETTMVRAILARNRGALRGAARIAGGG